MYKNYLKYTLLVVSLLVVSVSSAQGPPPPPPSLPIDGGVGLLLVLGAGYAIKKLRKKE